MSIDASAMADRRAEDGLSWSVVMPWIPRADMHTLLGLKRISGFNCIDILEYTRECVFWTATMPSGGRKLVLGSPEALTFFQRGNINRFAVGFADVEVTLFLLLRDTSGVWYAYRADRSQMFRIDDLSTLTFDLVMSIAAEFRERL